MEPDLILFRFDHLPAHLRDVSKIFHDVAAAICEMVPERGQKGSAMVERGVALRKLLEAKDAAVRARMLRSDV